MSMASETNARRSLSERRRWKPCAGPRTGDHDLQRPHGSARQRLAATSALHSRLPQLPADDRVTRDVAIYPRPTCPMTDT
jgi:hypothetical protein